MAPKYEACKDCQIRSTGCHSHCKAYLAFHEATEKQREERLQKNKDTENYRSVRSGRTYALYRNKERK